MVETINLSSKIQKQLPIELIKFMRAAGDVAQRQGQPLYLVGGVVRDLLLGRANFDLDLVVEGDAISLASQLTSATPAKLVTHPCFGTAKLQWDKWSVDLASARSETYAKPGALPAVKPGSIKEDLSRRDFTVNTMAVELQPGRYGELLDLYGGRDDLERKFIRVLHDKSFKDDATRIWRGLRYEQRLGFQFEANTLQLLKRDMSWLDTISGDRIRHEIELILREELPEKVLRRADELGVLVWLHPSLEGNDWLVEKFGQARELSSPDLPSVDFYLSLLAYMLTEEENEQLVSYLRLPKSAARILHDTAGIKAELGLLANPDLTPSSIYSLLQGYSAKAIVASSIAIDLPLVHQRIDLFLCKLRYVKPALTGDDLQKMGVAPGPRIKEILNLLRNARLDGEVSSKKEEEELVRESLKGLRPF